MSWLIRLTLAILVAYSCFEVWIAVELHAGVYYVSPQGSNDGDGSIHGPWRTIQKAADTARAGDTVFLRDGTYFEIVSLKNCGTEGNPITFRTYPGERACIDGAGKGGWYGNVTIQGTDHLRLVDLEIRNNPIGWGVLIEHGRDDPGDSATGIDVEGVHIHHTGAEAIQIRGNAKHIKVSRCTVHDAPRTSGIDIYQWGGGRPSHITVRGCQAYGYPGFAGIASEQADHLIIEHNTSRENKLGLDIGSGARNLIRHNVISACETGIALSSNSDSEVCGNVICDIQNEAMYAYYWSEHGEPHARNRWLNNTVRNAGFGVFESNQKGSRGRAGSSADHHYLNNLFINIGLHGSHRTSFFFQGTIGLRFENNTIYMNPHHHALEFVYGSRNAEVRNNIISVAGRGQPFILEASSNPGSTVEGNCYHNRDGRAVGVGRHDINEDPKFLDPERDDFRLPPSSPCIGAGVGDKAVLKGGMTPDLSRPESADFLDRCR
jgi:hypothetical protein